MRVALLIGFMILLALGLTMLYRSVPLNRDGQVHRSQTGQEVVQGELKQSKDDHLVIVWTSGDPEVALNMVLMYAYNAKKRGWWQNVTLLVWGPSQKLAVENQHVREELARLQGAGVVLEACKACSDRYGVSDELAACSIDVKYMGEPLTAYIKEAHVISF